MILSTNTIGGRKVTHISKFSLECSMFTSYKWTRVKNSLVAHPAYRNWQEVSPTLLEAAGWRQPLYWQWLQVAGGTDSCLQKPKGNQFHPSLTNNNRKVPTATLPLILLEALWWWQWPPCQLLHVVWLIGLTPHWLLSHAETSRLINCNTPELFVISYWGCYKLYCYSKQKRDRGHPCCVPLMSLNTIEWILLVFK